MNKIHASMMLALGMLLNNVTISAQTYATLPLTETFENAWINKDDTRDVPSVYWKNIPATGDNSWSRNDDGIARGAWTSEYYRNPGGANGSSYSASFNSWKTYLSGTLDLYVDFGSLAGSKALYFWYNNYGGDDRLEVSLSTDGGITFGSPLITLYNTNIEWTKACLDLGLLNSSTGVIRFKGMHVLDQSSAIAIDDVYVGIHSSTPIVADFSTDRISGIAPLTVNFTDNSTGDVTNWSWDFNNDGIIDAITQNPVYTFYTVGTFTTKLTSYKPGISTSKSITITTTPQVYATLPFIEDFNNQWVNREGTRDVPSLSFKNNPCTGDNSWRRSDDGVSAGWMIGSPYTPIGAIDSQYYARFSRFSSSSGIMDVFIDFSTQTGNKTLSFWYTNFSGNDKLEIYVSTDGGLTFGPVLLTLAIQKSWEKVVYDLGNINSSTGVIRFKTIMEYDSRDNGDDIGIDNIRLSNPTEIPIDAYFTSNIITGPLPLTVNFTDKTGGAPTSWEWDFNNDGVIDATIQNPSYTYSTPGLYTVRLTAGKLNDSEEVIRTNYIVAPGYAGLPYNQTFENEWVHRDDYRDVPDNFWKNNTATGSNYWTRNDDAVIGMSSSYKPSGVNGSLHSACFNTYSAYNDNGSIDLHINFSSEIGDKRLTFWYINRGGNDTLEVFLSTDGGATFGTAITALGISTFWTKITVNLGNITSTLGVLRFKATTINSDPTYTNIGIDDIKVAVPALLPLNAEFSSNVISGDVPLTVNFKDQSDGAPTSWEWDFNNDGTVDETTQNASFTYTHSGIYDVKLTIRNGGDDDVELKTKYVLVPGYASLPFSESFEKPWLSRDGNKDVPSEFAKNTPPTGDNSWSRDDEGFSRSAWGYSVGYPYSPTGGNSSAHSARFNSGAGYNSGILDFHLNFSTMPGEKVLTFWYFNGYSGGSADILEIFLSTDGGTTFGSVLQTLTENETWTKKTISLGSSVSSTCVLRFKATGVFVTTDIGIDEIKINAVEAAFTANIITGTTPLTVYFTDKSSGSPTSWKWDFNNDGIIDATSQNPNYTFTSPGNYSVKLIVTNTGSTDTIVTTDYIVVSLPTDIDQIVLSEKKVHVYPNPISTWVKVKLYNFGSEKIKLEVVGIQGTIISTFDATGQESYELDFSGYARGIYFLKTHSNNQIFINKLILQ